MANQNLGLGNLREFTLSPRTTCEASVRTEQGSDHLHQENLPVYHMAT